MTVDALGLGVGASDVLPSRVRRRVGARDGWLAAVLTGELLAGVVLGAAWEARADLGRLWHPEPVASSSRAGGPAGAPAETPAWVVVPPPVVAPPAPPPLRTSPRDPFAVQAR